MLQPIIDSLRFFRNNLEKIATLLTIFVVISRLIEFAISEFVAESVAEVEVVGYKLLLSALLNIVFQCTFIVMLVKISQNQQVGIGQCFRQALPIMPIYFLGATLFQIIIFVGVVILLVFPGVYAYARLSFFDFALITQRVGGPVAKKTSRKSSANSPIILLQPLMPLVDATKTSWRVSSGSVVKILLTLMPVAIAMLFMVAAFGLIEERTLALEILASFIFWVFGAFLVVVRYRLYTILSDPKRVAKNN